MRYASANKRVLLAAVLIAAGAAGLAIVPVPGFAGETAGNSTTATTLSAPPQRPDGEDLITKPDQLQSVPMGANAAAGFAAQLKAEQLRARIRSRRKVASYWANVMGVHTPPFHPILAKMDIPELRPILAEWAHTAAKMQLRAQHPPHLAQLLCIHSGIKGGRWIHLQYLGGGVVVGHGEGSWTDHGAPYYGGLQMDVSFMRSYGGWLYQAKGTADHWSPLEQIWAAERGYRAPDPQFGIRGFHPWPNTARDCDLL